MKSITIKGSERESVGKKATKAVRDAGMVPCVIYGGNKPVHFAADKRAFMKLVYTPNAHTVVVELEKGEKINCILQDIQFHPVTDAILHIDFFEIHEDREIVMEVPIKVEGNSPGVMEGGVLRLTNRRLKVKALPSKLPDFVTVNISNLKMSSKLYVTEIETEGYKLMHPDNTVVCQVRVSRAAMKAAQDAEKEAGAEAEKEAGAES